MTGFSIRVITIETAGFCQLSSLSSSQVSSPARTSFAGTKWLAENGKSINDDTTRLAVAGGSVGGNMATAVMLLAKERGGPKIAFQVLFYRVTDANFDSQSYIIPRRLLAHT